MINWSEITTDNLPTGEVIAINDKGESMTGQLYQDKGLVILLGKQNNLYNLTHYSIINKP